MLNANVATFLKKAQTDSVLAAHVNCADTYQELESVSQDAGVPAGAGDFRAAFRERNARVLVHLMMRRGAIGSVPLDPVPPMDLELWERVSAMDLSAVVYQMVTYQGWSRPRAIAVERRYRRFFYLKSVMPGGMASPTREVDEFWHQHIINTHQYEPDCMRVAGRFLHHTFLSFDNPLQARELSAVWLNTWTSYESLFEEPYQETAGMALLQRWRNIPQ